MSFRVLPQSCQPPLAVQNSLAQEPPNEILLEIFAHLDPEALVACRRTCLSWAGGAYEESLYIKLSGQLQFFFRKERDYFRTKSRQKFLQHYFEMFPLLRKGPERRFQRVLTLQTPGNEHVKTVWNAIWSALNLHIRHNLDSTELDPTQQAALVAHYQGQRAMIVACLNAGGMAFENPKEIRSLQIAAYFAAVDIAARIHDNTAFPEEFKQRVLNAALWSSLSGLNKGIMVPLLVSWGASTDTPVLFGFTFNDYWQAITGE